MGDMPYNDLRLCAAALGVSGDDVARLLGCYADGLRDAEPPAWDEIELAMVIGINIKDILEGVE